MGFQYLRKQRDEEGAKSRRVSGNSAQSTLRGDLPGGPVVKNPTCNAEDVGLIPGQRTKIPHVRLLQSCSTLCDPMDGSPPGSSVRGIL